MSRTVENPDKLRGTLRAALRELADDARAYLKLLEKLSATEPGAEGAYRDLELDVRYGGYDPVRSRSKYKRAI